jgi:hypothetical protein
MRNVAEQLRGQLRSWQDWAQTASHDENGWESDAPNWEKIIGLAKELLIEEDLADTEVFELEKVFCLSEETEDLADFLKASYGDVPKLTIRELSKSAHPNVRWQVYDSLLSPDEFSRELLLAAMEDTDAYVRRRAFLRLLSVGIPTRLVLEQAAADDDSVIRERAKQLLKWGS